MSKKAKRAAKKVKKAVRSAATRHAPQALAAAQSQRTAAATIFIYDAGGEFRVRTSPQRLTAGAGWVEWTVVNLTSQPMPDVEISWQTSSPWGGAAIPVRNGNARKALPSAAGAPKVFKYNVKCNGYTEDPELEFPVN
jgi:hypothetical protein